MLAWCHAVPHGVLCFFPSYGLLERVEQRWRDTGLWRRIEEACGKARTRARGASVTRHNCH